MRVAAVDIGTNTVLLLVADRADDGQIAPVAEHARITRLGQGVDATRRLAPEAIERTIACLEDYARIVRELSVAHVGVVGTSAMRDAHGAERLRALVRDRFGVEVRVISGSEEARLTFRGALCGLPAERNRRVAVFDIGGGSTEVVIGLAHADAPAIDYAASFDVGSVRLSERYCASDPPRSEEIERVRRAAQDAFRAVPPLPADSVPVGIAGTMTTLAAVFLGLSPYEAERVHGLAVRKESLEQVCARLAALDLASRRKVVGMDPGRADVVVTGALIALELLAHWHASSVTISDRGVRWGLAQELGT